MQSGAISAASPKEAATKSDVLMTSLRDDCVLLDVVTVEEGILSGLQSIESMSGRQLFLHLSNNLACQKIIRLGNEHATANTLELSANYVMVVPLDLMGQVYALGEKSGINCNL